MSDRVTIQIENGVADVRLARPDKLNACDHAMFVGLVEAGKSLAADRSVRAVVLSGEGRGFSAGLDVTGFAGSSGDSDGPSLFERGDESPANRVQRAAWIWKELPVPVIAAVHGPCLGAGLQIALAADIRFVAPDARLSVMEIKWGLVPDVTATQTLRQLVRLDVAKELTYSGRIVSGREAAELGLATRVCDDPRAEAFELARQIAGRSPDAIRAAKRLLETAMLGSVEDGLVLEEKMQRSVMGRPNQLEAVKANLEKRAPRFEDPS